MTNADLAEFPLSQSPPSTREAEALVEDLARALHRYGTPSHRFEEAMVLVAERLGFKGQFFSTPTAITQVPGLMLLVPGSMGFRSVTALLENDTLAGVQTAFAMTLVAVALATGLLVANGLVPPRRAL